METANMKIKSIFKSLLIFGLAILTVFQVSQLWFVNITDRNFFLYVQAMLATGAPDGHDAFVRPFRIVYGAGDGYFNMRLSDISETEAWKYGEPMITAILSNGHFVAQTPIDRERLLSRQIFLYEYAFAMNAEIFTQAFGQRTSLALTGHGIENFYKIAIHPPSDDTSNLIAFFIDDDYAWEFSLPYHRAERIDIAPTPQDDLHFVPINSPNIGFAPVRPQGFRYHPISVANPYQSAFGSLHLSSVGAGIEPFFSNPATINQRPGTDGVYTFSNLNTMVRYLVNDVLEYTSFRPIGTTASSNFINDFSAAYAFVNADPHVVNEIFLAGYDSSRGREHVFLFSYIIDDFPIVLTEPWFTGPNCQDPLLTSIEVVVDNGRVVRYRRLAYNFHVIENLIFAFDTAVEAIVDLDSPFTLGFPISRDETMLELEMLGG